MLMKALIIKIVQENSAFVLDGCHCSIGGNLDCKVLSLALSFSYFSIRAAYVGILLA